MKAASHPILFGLTREELFRLCGLFFLWRVGLFIVGSVAGFFLPYAPTFPYAEIILPASHLPQWLFSWANFDGVHYITIAEKGYVGTGLIQAFFPFLPLVMLRSLYLLTDGHLNTLLVGLVITNIAFLAGLIAWYVFVKKLQGERKAWWAVAFLLAFPTSLFFGALYTESIFFFLVIGAFIAAQKQSWGWAAVFTVCATATRVVGIFLVPALFIELWLQWRERQTSKMLLSPLPGQLVTFVKQSWKQLLLVGIGSLGLFAYMLYLARTFGDPLYFLHVQSEFGAGRTEGFVTYPQVLWRSIKILMTLSPNTTRYYPAVLEFLAGSVGLAGLLISAWKIRLSYVLFALGAFFMPTFTGTFSSMPRYILICFPLYLLLSDGLANRPTLRVALLTISVISLVINTVFFVQGYWLS